MNKSILVAFFLILSTSLSFAQNNINNYKYIIVPKQYEFQKSEDSYQINSLTKFLFERAGFTVFFSTDTFPTELANNGCLALKAIINDGSGMFNTKLNINLVDCYNKTIFSTHEAKSKIKDYQKAYQATIREAFVDIEALNYAYNNVNIIEDKKLTNIKEPVIKEIIPKVDNTKSDKAVELVKTEVAAIPVKKEVEVIENNIEVVVEGKLLSNISIEGTYMFDTWGKSSISKVADEYVVIGGDENVELATIYKTSKPNIYIIKWRAFKQPQLVEIDADGNLHVDSINGKKVYDRM